MGEVRFWPEQAGSYAVEIDWLFFSLLAVTGFVFFLLAYLMIRFITRYREASTVERGPAEEKTWVIEIAWTGASLVIFLGFAAWGAHLFLRLYQPPENALEIFVVAKQWMWKTQHAGGQREINALHVPVHRPIRLVMASQDVIHSFFVPAFRVKHDVVPGRYETLWFEAVKTGTFGLLCAEYCGTLHSGMIGQVVVMEPRDFERWLATQPQADDLAQEGAALFRRYGCSGCHGAGGTVKAPPLEGLYGHPVPLADGRIVQADERYIRDSILLPKQEVAAGYPNIMPSFVGEMPEEDLLRIVAYIKSIADAAPAPRSGLKAP